MHGRHIEQLREVRAGEPDGATPTAIKAPYPMREAALHTRPQCILGYALGGLLPLSRSLDRLVVGLRPDRELAWGLFGSGACRSGRIGATGGLGKADAHDRIAGGSAAWGPFDTGMPLGAARVFRLPIDH